MAVLFYWQEKMGQERPVFSAAFTAERFRPYTEKGDEVRGAFLPLTPNRILIGEPNVSARDFVKLKRQIARCSLEYFIAHESTAENIALQSEIGADAAILSKDELKEIAVECFREFGKA